MDIASIGGILLALISLILAFIFDGGSLTALMQPTAALIVVGGTIGATLASVSLRQFMAVGKYLKIAFFPKSSAAPLVVIEQLVELASVARREGILALEERVETFHDEFLQNGIRLVVDGVDPELVKSMLETELAYVEDRHLAAAKIFDTAGGYAPTMGIIGTVMGLVHVLSSLQNVDALGPEIAVAFTATLYGVGTANIVWLPLGSKLKARNSEEVLMREIMIEGILSIQAGENPNILRQKLKAFLAPSLRQEKSVKKAGEVDVETVEA
jgi:chemotaxis protein MotA